ncbi:unnamed protein product [Allacma fusca]|uniref:Uncharacterized protein n=1 Tax=Allacma fusca TaxID=39272 RepID=A0A8J2PAV3_9HEXA|nr:unnamed protein product [Allacma fusca]
MGGKHIVCCGTGTWTRVIGWLELVRFGYLTVVYCAIPSAVEDEMSLLPGLTDGNGAMVIFIGTVLTYAFFTIMAIILLCGAYQRITCLITAWWIYSIVSICMNSLVIIGLLANVGAPSFDLVQVVVDTLFRTFCLWIVGIYRAELKSALNCELLTIIEN